ncbi:hypothetical protein FHT44_005170 [Mycolicibacterium sp. BK634]|nr:hypothetical protein [Mycolicibacterium sp. BK634]MBB3752658.1 hypothetical protein [Mycolicibacterium sp. BK634]
MRKLLVLVLLIAMLVGMGYFLDKVDMASLCDGAMRYTKSCIGWAMLND